MSHPKYQHNNKPNTQDPDMSPSQRDYFENMLKNIIGGCIESAVIVTDDSDKHYGTDPVIVLVVRNNHRVYHCEILSDEEGNDAGVLAVTEVRR
jgi:hypothetical protein